MSNKEIRKKLLTERYIVMPLGNSYGYFTIILPKHKKLFRRFKYVFDDSIFNIKLKDYGKQWWFINDEYKKPAK